MNIPSREHHVDFGPASMPFQCRYGFDLLTNAEKVLEKAVGDLFVSDRKKLHIFGLDIALSETGLGIIELRYSRFPDDGKRCSVIVDVNSSNIYVNPDVYISHVRRAVKYELKPNPGMESELVERPADTTIRDGGLLEFLVWESINPVYQKVMSVVELGTGTRFTVPPRSLDCMRLAKDLIYGQFVLLPNLEKTIISPMPAPKAVAQETLNHQ